MKLEYNKQKDHLIIMLDGRLDANNAKQLEKALEEAINIGEHQLVLDMNKVSYLSSGGMRMLIKTQQILKKLNGALTISNPAPLVQNVLGLAGLLDFFVPLTQQEQRRNNNRSNTPHEQHSVINNVSCSIYNQTVNQEMQCQLRGYPELLQNGTVFDYPSDNLKCREGFHSIGLGVLGNNPGDLKSRGGEYITVSGMAVHQPGDGSVYPDYMHSIADFQPSVQSAYSIEMTGDFSYCIRFESREENITFTDLLQMLFTQFKTGHLGMVMLARTDGIVGAALNMPPVSQNNLFSFPEIKNRIYYTTEPIASHKMALVSGIAVNDGYERCMPFLRPFAPDLYGHFHAALFDNRLLHHGKLELHRTVSALIGDQVPFKVLHLLNDDRDLTGAGDSRFSQGVIWISPLENITRKQTNGVIGGKKS